MFGFFKRKKKHDSQQEPQEQRPQELNDDAQLDEPPQEPLADVENGAPVTEPEPEVEPAPAPSETKPETSEPAPAPPEVKPEPPEPEVEPAPAPPDVKPEPPEPEVEPAPVPPEVKPEPPEPEIKPARESGASPVPEPEVDPEPAEPDVQPEIQPEQKPALQEKPGEKKGWFARIKSGLGKTRANLTDGIADLFLGKKQIDDELLEDLETQLLMADVGIEATSEIIGHLEARVSRKELNNPEALYRALQEELAAMLGQVATPLDLSKQTDGPFVILVVGVNGVGKTTTIGKLTQRFQREGKSVMLAAGDTFRAAAVEQLKVWGERNSVPVIAQHTGADSASVIYDAVAAAKARGVDILIADTAGRLHNKSHLMEELKKVHRVMQKLDTTAPHEVMLVLDAGTGQNAIAQASTFHEAVPITGITLTKLDGTAKGGIIFALAKQLETPIRFIGVGEGLDDLRPFEADDFVSALFDRQEDDASA